MPEKIGPYTVVSQLGRGGMGVVYKGRDESLNRFVAIKVLTENLSEDPTFLQRFIREAQAAAALSHPNVVQIYFTGQDEQGHPYFVMEYVSGQSLDHVLRSQGRVDNPRASQLILQAAHGLAAAHDLGIIHRDIKPANLMLDDRGMVKIADFGLALPASAETRLTATGLFVGTPGYLSPEQCAGEKADHRTDIYALGVTYYMLLTGTPPFRGDSPLALIKQILDANPPDVTTVNPNIDPESRRILSKMIARERENRYQSCHELVADLDNLLASMGVRSMTAGFATRTPVATAADVTMVTAPTAIVAGNAAAKASEPPPAAVTQPDMPLMSAPTSPVIQPPQMAAAPPAIQPQPPAGPGIPPQPMKKGVSTSTLLIAAVLVFVLLAGGAIAAVMFGTKIFRGDDSTAVKAAAKTSGEKAPVSNPPQEALLSQAITTPSVAPGQAAPEPLTSPDPTPGSAQQQPDAEPARQQAPAVLPRARQTTPSQASAPAPEPRRRALSGVAVAATGDQALLGAVSSVLRAEAEAAGLDAVDAHSLPATEEMLQGRVALRDLIGRLQNNGYAVLMLARIEPTGQRELSYYGRRDIAYSARITVTAYDLASGRPFGRPQTGEIRYTSINVESESQDVVTPLAQAVAEVIRERSRQ